MAWLSGYARRQTITFAPASALAEAVSAAPVCIRPGDLTGLVQADMDDAVVTLADGVTLTDYYWESKALAAPVGHARIDLPAGSGPEVEGYLYTGNASATDQSNEAGVFSSCVARYALSEASGTILDSCGSYNGTPSGVAYGRVGKIASALEFDGNNNYVTIGDVTPLNSASAFTISFWMNQDVANANDNLFMKYLDGSNYIRVDTSSSGYLLARIYAASSARGYLGNYSSFVPAEAWSSVSVVYDGALSSNSTRLKLFVNGSPITILFVGSIPTHTANLAGAAANIGYSTTAFDGKLDEFQIASSAWSASRVLASYLSGMGTLLTIGAVETQAFPGRVVIPYRMGPKLHY